MELCANHSSVLDYEPYGPMLQKSGYPCEEQRCGGKFLMGMESDCQFNPVFNIKASFCECHLINCNVTQLISIS